MFSTADGTQDKLTFPPSLRQQSMTYEFIGKLDAVVVFADGQSKRHVRNSFRLIGPTCFSQAACLQVKQQRPRRLFFGRGAIGLCSLVILPLNSFKLGKFESIGN